MKKKDLFSHLISITLFLMLFVSLKSYALDYTITFTGTGASTTVESVIVQNLTKGTTVTVPAGNVLNLNDGPNAVEQLNANDEFIRIYPNLVEGKSIVSFFAKQAGSTQINAFSIDGRKIAGITENLQTGSNSFLLSLPTGAFSIQVVGNGYTYTAKMINQTGTARKPEIAYIGTVKPATSNPQKSKSSALGTTTMTYTTGDQLLYKGTSGNYSTIITDVPNGSKSINFVFVDCTDADGNYYTIVTIGTQTWMASNLRVTHYRNGESITNLTVDADWTGATSGAWCDQFNLAANGIKYGHLYNWYAASDSRNIAPVGWHVATDAEWTTLENYLVANGYNYDGTTTGNKIAKSLAATTDWYYDTGTGTIGNDLTKNNTSGITALPGGYRNFDGTFFYIGIGGDWWSSTEYYLDLAWFRGMDYYYSSVSQYYLFKVSGFSVRCLIGDIPVLSTTTASTITSTSAISGGNVTADGNATVTTRGVCWNTTGNPTIADNKTTDGSGSGTFVSNLSNLASGTTYYVRAYATNSLGTGYGSQVSFTTPDIVRLVSACGSITRSYAKASQNVKSNTQTDITAQTDVYLSKNSSPSYPKLPQTLIAAKTLTVTDPTVVTLPYGTSLNLVDNVIAIYNSVGFDIAGYGLNYKFDLLDESGNTIVYITGSTATNQQQFIRINDAARGTIQAPDATAAQGTTPIVRVTMYNPQNPTCSVLMSFIKIYMAVKPLPTPVILPFSFSYAVASCSDVTGVLTTQQMSQIYVATGLSMTEFNQLYIMLYSGEGAVTQTASTYLLNWTLTANQIWTKVMASDPATFTATAVYTPSVPTLYPTVTVTLTRRFTKPASLNISSTMSIFWYPVAPNVTNTPSTSASTPMPWNYVKHTIYLPSTGETNSALAVFQNNINQAFVQNANMSLNGLTNYEYYFIPNTGAATNGLYLNDNSQPIMTVNGVTYQLTPSADGQRLYNGAEIVATINPFVTNIGDVLVLNQTSSTAKRLLNYGSEFLKVRIGIRTVVCSNIVPNIKMPVTINGKPYFDVVFVRPINPVANSSLYFKDGLNYGDPYTYLGISSLVNLNDWRYPNTVASFATHSNYYQYYGITNITVDVSNIKTDLNQTGSTLVLLSSIPYLRVYTALTVPGVTNPTSNFYGYLTYNNTTGIAVGKAFNLYVPVTITYVWGSIVTTQLQIQVTN